MTLHQRGRFTLYAMATCLLIAVLVWLLQS